MKRETRRKERRKERVEAAVRLRDERLANDERVEQVVSSLAAEQAHKQRVAERAIRTRVAQEKSQRVSNIAKQVSTYARAGKEGIGGMWRLG